MSQIVNQLYDEVTSKAAEIGNLKKSIRSTEIEHAKLIKEYHAKELSQQDIIEQLRISQYHDAAPVVHTPRYPYVAIHTPCFGAA